jgi:hypothetical protein
LASLELMIAAKGMLKTATAKRLAAGSVTWKVLSSTTLS